MFYITGPDDGNRIFDNWYTSDTAAWRAVTRYVRKQGLKAPPEPAELSVTFRAELAETVNAFQRVGGSLRDLAEAPAKVASLRQLVNDLWEFIDNTADDAADRADRFFDLRARVREAGAPENGFKAAPDFRALIGRAAEYVERFADLAEEPDGGDCRSLLAELKGAGL